MDDIRYTLNDGNAEMTIHEMDLPRMKRYQMRHRHFSTLNTNAVAKSQVFHINSLLLAFWYSSLHACCAHPAGLLSKISRLNNIGRCFDANVTFDWSSCDWAETIDMWLWIFVFSLTGDVGENGCTGWRKKKKKDKVDCSAPRIGSTASAIIVTSNSQASSGNVSQGPLTDITSSMTAKSSSPLRIIALWMNPHQCPSIECLIN